MSKTLSQFPTGVATIGVFHLDEPDIVDLENGDRVTILPPRIVRVDPDEGTETVIYYIDPSHPPTLQDDPDSQATLERTWWSPQGAIRLKNGASLTCGGSEVPPPTAPSFWQVKPSRVSRIRNGPDGGAPEVREWPYHTGDPVVYNSPLGIRDDRTTGPITIYLPPGKTAVFDGGRLRLKDLHVDGLNHSVEPETRRTTRSSTQAATESSASRK